MDPAVDLAIRTGLALLVAAAAIHKLRDVERFRGTVADYRILPAGTATIGAVAAIGAELATAAMLLLPDRRALGPIAAAALLLVYAVALALNLARGRRHLDCGCVGTAGREEISWALVVRNLVLVLLALLAAGPLDARALGWVDAVTVAAAIATAAGAYVAVDQLVANQAGYRRLRGTT